MKQLTGLVDSIERLGHATVPVKDLTVLARRFFRELHGIYYVYLPAKSVNYVIAKAAPNGKPDAMCSVEGLGRHNLQRV